MNNPDRGLDKCMMCGWLPWKPDQYLIPVAGENGARICNVCLCEKRARLGLKGVARDAILRAWANGQ